MAENEDADRDVLLVALFGECTMMDSPGYIPAVMSRKTHVEFKMCSVSTKTHVSKTAHETHTSTIVFDLHRAVWRKRVHRQQHILRLGGVASLLAVTL